jgi:hypothetical protein
MSLTYKLVPNLLSSDEDDYIAVMVRDEHPKFLADLENPLELFGLSIKDQQVVTTESSELIESLIKEGHCLFTPIINMRFGIKGNFKGENDEFDNTRHSKKAYMTAGRSLLKKFKDKSNK